MSSELTATTPLSALLAARSIAAHRVSFTVTDDWQQGRTAFGGLLSALSAQAMRDVCGADWPMRALQTNFVGPVGLGTFHVDVALLRQGKNVRQVKATVVQADAQGVEQVCGILLGVFGTGRTSEIPQRRPVQPPVAVSAEASAPLPYLPGLTPNFTQHLDFRLAEGAFPFTGGGDWLTRYHLRLKDSAGVDPELIAIMLTDAGPTPALSQAKRFAPASSVSWALELRPVTNVDPEGLWRLDQDTIAYDEGYANDRAHLWTPDGQLAAFGYQVVAVYA
ncbi:MAG: thioesterase family protein [Aquabacterium sp.]|uniref:acyl-CoA thioesterase n=1 Tax=Aquabacterium sp. TaxID=1872578 RepID=UPI002721933D|nr:thioesterase family protein [Aquabacterium sp.]MDO9002818.1 thioesterase family protein [Aquabacterium sp.]